MFLTTSTPPLMDQSHFDPILAKEVCAALAFDGVGKKNLLYFHSNGRKETEEEIFYDAMEDHYYGGGDENNNQNALLATTVRGGDSDYYYQQEGSDPSPQDNLSYQQQQQYHQPQSSFDPPAPPGELPDRFLRAGKGDPVEGMRRYHATLQWRQQYGMDYIIKEASPRFALIKQHYPHYFHLRGRNGEPVYFEKPPKTNLKALRAGGVGVEDLLRHYAMVTEFGWQVLERNDSAKSITVIDLEGIRMTDFVGDCVDFVRKASAFTGAHYPERAGYVFVVNVPSWFSFIWNVVKPMVDEVTLKKIYILRDKKAVFEAMLERIPIENIPPEYGGQSMPLGQSPEEQMIWGFMNHNNDNVQGTNCCQGPCDPVHPCQFCTFVPARSY